VRFSFNTQPIYCAIAFDLVVCRLAQLERVGHWPSVPTTNFRPQTNNKRIKEDAIMNGHWECRLSTGGLKSTVFATLPEFFDRSTQPAQLAAHIRETHGCDPEEIVWVVEQKRGRRTRYVDDTTYVKVGDKWEFAMAELPEQVV
jgi:hypothetical protein